MFPICVSLTFAWCLTTIQWELIKTASISKYNTKVSEVFFFIDFNYFDKSILSFFNHSCKLQLPIYALMFNEKRYKNSEKTCMALA